MSKEEFQRLVESFPMKDPFRFEVVPRYETIKITMSHGNAEVGYLLCYIDGVNMWFESGRTFERYRRLGYGTWMRAVAAWCAKKAGYKRLFQTSTRLTNTPKTARPTSAYIMNKLGFQHTSGNSNNNNNREHRVLNLNQNIPHVNAIIRNIRR